MGPGLLHLVPLPPCEGAGPRENSLLLARSNAIVNGIVAFRSAKGRPFAERKATITSAKGARDVVLRVLFARAFEDLLRRAVLHQIAGAAALLRVHIQK